MEDICCKTMNIDDFKGRCSSSDPGKDCQICPFINHLVNRVKNISSRLEVCILDVQDFKNAEEFKAFYVGVKQLIPMMDVPIY
jgi:hypothetical protein